MRPPQPDNRLRAAAAMVRPGSVAADVGTDHGRLALYLVQSGRCPKVYATDLRAAPLAQARALARRFGLEEQIICLQGDGLACVPPGGATDIVVAGMGGQTVIPILEKAPWLRRKEIRLILEPASDAHLVRRWLCENGFTLSREEAVEAGGRFYGVMQAEYTGKAFTPDEVFCHCGLLPAKTAAARGYFGRLVALMEEELDGKAKSPRFGDLSQSRALLNQLKGVLEQCRE